MFGAVAMVFDGALWATWPSLESFSKYCCFFFFGVCSLFVYGRGSQRGWGGVSWGFGAANKTVVLSPRPIHFHVAAAARPLSHCQIIICNRPLFFSVFFSFFKLFAQ